MCYNLLTDKKDLPAEVDEGDKSSSTQRSQKPTTEVLGRMHPSTTRGSGAVQTVKEFKYTEQPSCFLVPMCPSYIEKHTHVSSLFHRSCPC